MVTRTQCSAPHGNGMSYVLHFLVNVHFRIDRESKLIPTNMVTMAAYSVFTRVLLKATTDIVCRRWFFNNALGWSKMQERS